jgi:membrane associated rhomboid family serine protease
VSQHEPIRAETILLEKRCESRATISSLATSGFPNNFSGMISEYETSDEHRPVLWFRGYPVYAAHVIVAAFALSMFCTAFLNLFNAETFLRALSFNSSELLRGQVWRALTYGFENRPSVPLVINLAVLAWCGREVERYFGRRSFLLLFAGLYLLPPVFFGSVGLWWPTEFFGEKVCFAVFIAFAAIFPEAPIFFTLNAKWVSIILFGVYTLIFLNYRDAASLVTLWITSGFAYAYVRRHQGSFSLSVPNPFRRKQKLRVLEGNPHAAVPQEPPASMSEIDALLDKIAQNGMGSLTTKERAKLDAARADLLRRQSKR